MMAEARKKHPMLTLLKVLLRLFYARHAINGAEQVLPAEPAVFICNHLDTYAPIVMQLYFPFRFRPWVHANMMIRQLCRAYLEQDFTRKTLKLQPPASRWLAAIIAPFCIMVMRSVEAIPVFRGQMRIRQTFSLSVAALRQGDNLLIYPEHQTRKYSVFLNDFHTGFVHLALQYKMETGQTLRFYPVYVNSKQKTITIGQAIVYTSGANFHAERSQISENLRDSINKIAAGSER